MDREQAFPPAGIPRQQRQSGSLPSVASRSGPVHASSALGTASATTPFLVVRVISRRGTPAQYHRVRSCPSSRDDACETFGRPSSMSRVQSVTHASGPDRKRVAEREGFEPPIGLHLCRISSAVHSTTLPPLQGAKSGPLSPPWSGPCSRRGRLTRQGAAAKISRGALSRRAVGPPNARQIGGPVPFP